MNQAEARESCKQYNNSKLITLDKLQDFRELIHVLKSFEGKYVFAANALTLFHPGGENIFVRLSFFMIHSFPKRNKFFFKPT